MRGRVYYGVSCFSCDVEFSDVQACAQLHYCNIIFHFCCLTGGSVKCVLYCIPYIAHTFRSQPTHGPVRLISHYPKHTEHTGELLTTIFRKGFDRPSEWVPVYAYNAFHTSVFQSPYTHMHTHTNIAGVYGESSFNLSLQHK